MTPKNSIQTLEKKLDHWEANPWKNKSTRARKWLLTMVGFVLLLEVVAASLYASYRQISPQTYTSVKDFSDIVNHLGGAYPPGPKIVYFVLRSIADWGPYAWNGILCLLAALGLYVLYRQTEQQTLSPDRKMGRVIAPSLLALNGYGVWLMITSQDSALENVFFIWGIVLYFWAARSKRAKTLCWMACSIAPLMSSMMRVSSFFLWFGWFLFGLLCGKKFSRLGILSVVLGIVGYSTLNYIQHHTFSLTTTTAVNLVAGHHPQYLNIHPQHDIETLTGGSAWTNPTGPSQAIDFIVQDPVAEIVRCASKLQWYFLGITKIPMLSDIEPAALIKDNRLYLGRQDYRLTLFYLPYGILFVFLFWASLIYYMWKKDWDSLCFYAPFFIMAGLSVLLFPDTRFRQAAEILLYIPMSVFVATVIIPAFKKNGK